MNATLQSLITFGIIALAFAWLVRQCWHKSPNACGCGKKCHPSPSPRHGAEKSPRRNA